MSPIRSVMCVGSLDEYVDTDCTLFPSMSLGIFLIWVRSAEGRDARSSRSLSDVDWSTRSTTRTTCLAFVKLSAASSLARFTSWISILDGHTYAPSPFAMFPCAVSDVATNTAGGPPAPARSSSSSTAAPPTYPRPARPQTQPPPPAPSAR
eukprot:CAMPEP_0182900544 /NCGR_PEP_ID=MMETSP0034_2-20130328/28926_1 /TAXON_ID=156128 /ORGANISM="Nephroselmis pyriformis, Strain CCMP717" /LENGTH=150 /DNA_ID=CAMNT_0025034773 /DNA_START=443 /DNA_END=893 /DNA_ORIENTATION=+